MDLGFMERKIHQKSSNLPGFIRGGGNKTSQLTPAVDDPLKRGGQEELVDDVSVVDNVLQQLVNDTASEVLPNSSLHSYEAHATRARHGHCRIDIKPPYHSKFNYPIIRPCRALRADSLPTRICVTPLLLPIVRASVPSHTAVNN
eukprot:9488960-Pyramimonas_sp.AAC.2